MSNGTSAQFTLVFTALDKATATMQRINKSIASVGAPLGDIGKRLTALAEETGLTTLGERAVLVGEKFGHLGREIAELAGPLAALGAAGTAAGLFEMAKGAAEFGKQLYVGQMRTGISADQLAKLHFAGSTVGLEADQMDLSLERLNRTIAQTASGKNKQAAALFSAMHVSLFNANHTLKDAVTLLPQLSKHFERNGSIAEKTNAAMILMGRSGAQMLPLFEMGGDEMQKLFGTFEKMYGKITPEVLKSAREGAESFEVLKLAAHGLSFTIGSALFPVLKDIITPITGWIAAHRQLVAVRVREWVTGIADALKRIDWNAVGTAVMSFVHGLEFVGRVLGPFGSTMVVAAAVFSPFITGALGVVGALGRFGMALGGVAIKVSAFVIGGGLPTLMVQLGAMTETVLPGLSAAFLSLGIAIEATPIGWIITGIAAVAAAAYLLYEYWTPIKNFFVGIWNGVSYAFQIGFDAMMSIVAPGQSISNLLTEDWKPVATFFANLWGDVESIFSEAGTAILSLIPGGTLVQSIMANWQGLPAFFGQLWSGLKPSFGWLKNFAIGATDYAVDYIKARWEPVAEFFDGLWQRAGKAFNWLKFFAIGASDYAMQGLKAVWQPVGAFFSGLWSGAVGELNSAWDGVSGFFSGLWESIKQVFVWGWNNVVPWIPGLNLVKMITDNWSSIPQFFHKLWTNVISVFDGMWKTLRPRIEAVVGGAKWLAEHTGLLDAYNTASHTTHVVVHDVSHDVAQTAGRVGNWFQKIEERAEAIMRLGNVARLSNLIASGEGTYDSVNLGQRGGYRASTVPLGNMTLAQVMAAQAQHQFNAAGRYQIITATLRDAVSKLHLNTGAKFDHAMQDRIFRQYLLGMKHPEIANYLSGRNNDVMAAARAASAEWASIADPRTGKSHYAGVGNNKASISVPQIVSALEAARVPSAAQRIPAMAHPVVADRAREAARHTSQAPLIPHVITAFAVPAQQQPEGRAAVVAHPVADARTSAISRPIVSVRAAGAEPAVKRSETDVNIRLNGFPPSTRVATRSTGDTKVNVDRGTAWVR